MEVLETSNLGLGNDIDPIGRTLNSFSMKSTDLFFRNSTLHATRRQGHLDVVDLKNPVRWRPWAATAWAGQMNHSGGDPTTHQPNAWEVVGLGAGIKKNSKMGAAMA